MNGWVGGLTALLVALVCPGARAEYIIYLKGGHYLVADDCTFSMPEASRQAEQPEGGTAFAEDCARGKPAGRIFWSTLDGRFGEVSADDVYAIFGAKTVMTRRPVPELPPLEDYLIVNRDESFINAKQRGETGAVVVGVKRDHLARVGRRDMAAIVRERDASGRSGEGLCPGETPDFSVIQVEVIGGHLGGIVTNLSTGPWQPYFEVEVRERGRFKGKFPVRDANLLQPGSSVPFFEPVPPGFLDYMRRVAEPEAGVQVCYRRVKTETGQAAR
jgi:hypothetical protein